MTIAPLSNLADAHRPNSDHELVEVGQPARWWVASPGDLPLPHDPRTRSHTPVDGPEAQRWRALARALDQVSHGLLCVGWSHRPGPVRTRVDTAGLDRFGWGVLTAWFAEGPLSDVVRADAWSGVTVSDARQLRRLWSVAPGARVPVRSNLLDRLDDVTAVGEVLGPVLAHEAEDGLRLMPARVAARNPCYIAELRRVVRAGAPPGSGSACRR